MSLQQVFFIAAIVLFVVTGVLAVLTIRMFIKQDIRGVRDDLSGKVRQRGIREAATSGSRHSTDRSVRRPSSRDKLDVEKSAHVEEDDIETMTDSALVMIKNDQNQGSDYKVAFSSENHRYDSTTMQESVEEDDRPTQVLADDQSFEDNRHEEVKDGSLNSAPLDFVITRSVVLIHSKEIISVG